MRTNDRLFAPVLARAFAVAILVPLAVSGCATAAREGPETREEVVFFPAPA